MPAKSEYLILARLALAGIAREMPMSETALADLKLAVTEACGNAVRHAYAVDRGVVASASVVERRAIEIEVVDEGDESQSPARAATRRPTTFRPRAAWGSRSSGRSSTSSKSTGPTTSRARVVRMRKRLVAA